jgi:TonB family protein
MDHNTHQDRRKSRWASCSLWVVMIAIAANAGACASRSRAGSASRPLDAPAPLSPQETAVLTMFPRTIDFAWAAVPGASRYGIEVDCYKCCGVDKWCADVDARRVRAHETPAPRYTDTFPGDQPGRWRVWAVDAKGQPGVKSAWRGFTFERPTPPSMTPGEFRNPATGEMVRGPGVVGPRAVYQPRPDYPDTALRDRVSGDVFMSVLVDATGRVEAVTVTKSVRPDLDESAVKTMKTWRFEPARKDGVAVPALVNASMNFYAK